MGATFDPGNQRRWSTTAATWLQKATALLSSNAAAARDADQRWLVGYDAEQLLRQLLWRADELVGLLPDDLLDDVLRDARALTERLRAQRLASKLENVEGRTVEEAAMFTERAAQLRERDA
jgi:hypothetical protein